MTGSIGSLGLVRPGVSCVVLLKESQVLYLVFSFQFCTERLPIEQIQMGSAISVPAVVRDKKEKEGTSNQSAREEFLHQEVLVLEPKGIVALPTIMRKRGVFVFCASAGRRVENKFCDISQSWVLNCDPHGVPHTYNPVGVTKHRITATTIGMGWLHLSLGLQYCLHGVRYI